MTMGYNMAKAKKLPSGSWRCEIYLGRDENGKKIRKSFTADTKKDAEYMASDYLINHADEPEKPEITFGTALDQYIQVKEAVLSPTTIRSYKQINKCYLSDFGKNNIDAITAANVQKLVSDVSIKCSPKTVRNVYGLVTAVLDLYRPDFHPRIKLPQKRPVELHTPSDTEVKAVINAVKGTELEKAILLAAFGPLRRGEICALTSDDIDFENNTITVNKNMVRSEKDWIIKEPKTEGSNRVVEFPEFVIKKFVGINGRLVNNCPDTITKSFILTIKALDVTPFRFHDLRHYSASIQHALGVPDKYIMERGGWTSTKTLNNIYKGVIDEERKKQTKKIIEHYNQFS